MAYRDYESGRYSSEPTSALAVYSPERVNNMGESGKKAIIKDMDETIRFFKKVGGMSDRDINKMKVADVKEQKEKVAQKMTIGAMRDWIQDGMVPEAKVTKIGRFVKDVVTFPFSLSNRGFHMDESVLATILGAVTVALVGFLVWRMYG